MQRTDTHTHTWYSGHGEGTPEEVVASALSLGLSTLAITEHMMMPPGFDDAGEFSLTAAQLPDYLRDVSAAQEAAQEAAQLAAPTTNQKLEILLGTEVDWRVGAEAFVLAQLQQAKLYYPRGYQIVLGSVHMLTGEVADDPLAWWPLDTPEAIDGFYERGLRYVWEHYVEHWIDAVTSKVNFTVMSHPDLPKKLGFKPDFDAGYLWQQMAEAAAAADCMIELNTAGLFAPCAEVYPGPQLLAEFARAGVPCTISSDAHTPANVSRAHAEAVTALLSAGYRQVTVPTADGDRRTIPIT